MKIEYLIYRVMSDGFEDLIWNGNSLIGFIKWFHKTRKMQKRVAYILVRGLWMPKHMTSINTKLILQPIKYD